MWDQKVYQYFFLTYNIVCCDCELNSSFLIQFYFSVYEYVNSWNCNFSPFLFIPLNNSLYRIKLEYEWRPRLRSEMRNNMQQKKKEEREKGMKKGTVKQSLTHTVPLSWVNQKIIFVPFLFLNLSFDCWIVLLCAYCVWRMGNGQSGSYFLYFFYIPVCPPLLLVTGWRDSMVRTLIQFTPSTHTKGRERKIHNI